MCGRNFNGRRDKIFCSEACKNQWHYRHGGGNELYRRRVFTALKANYRLLRGVLEAGKTSMDLLSMQDLGFKPAYMTGHRRARYGHDEYRCFDISYCMTQRRIFKIFMEEIEV